ncbi:MAG: adenylate/guanylate cyclase domain-containing protein [bacterium]
MSLPTSEDLDALFADERSTTPEKSETTPDTYNQVSVLYVRVEVVTSLETSKPEAIRRENPAAVIDDFKDLTEKTGLKVMPTKDENATMVPAFADDTEKDLSQAHRLAKLGLTLKNKSRQYQFDNGGSPGLRAGLEIGTIPESVSVNPHLCYDLTRRTIKTARALATKSDTGEIMVREQTVEAFGERTRGDFVFVKNQELTLSSSGSTQTYFLQESTNNPFCSI